MKYEGGKGGYGGKDGRQGGLIGKWPNRDWAGWGGMGLMGRMVLIWGGGMRALEPFWRRQRRLSRFGASALPSPSWGCLGGRQPRPNQTGQRQGSSRAFAQS